MDSLITILSAVTPDRVWGIDVQITFGLQEVQQQPLLFLVLLMFLVWKNINQLQVFHF